LRKLIGNLMEGTATVCYLKEVEVDVVRDGAMTVWYNDVVVAGSTSQPPGLAGAHHSPTVPFDRGERSSVRGILCFQGQVAAIDDAHTQLKDQPGCGT